MSDTPSGPSDERRRNASLREALDDLLDHVRDIAHNAGGMSAGELERAEERLEWLADEVWRAATSKGP
ncbi:MAG: hypothetical protein HY275_10830 [Gemmatimonadetes bacterium]|nr:hypothetical protein [Gemmatimonadota bacterium]